MTIPFFRQELACTYCTRPMWLKIALHARDLDWPLKASVRVAGDQIMYNYSSTPG